MRRETETAETRSRRRCTARAYFAGFSPLSCSTRISLKASFPRARGPQLETFYLTHPLCGLGPLERTELVVQSEAVHRHGGQQVDAAALDGVLSQRSLDLGVVRLGLIPHLQSQRTNMKDTNTHAVFSTSAHRAPMWWLNAPDYQLSPKHTHVNLHARGRVRLVECAVNKSYDVKTKTRA